MAVVSENAPKPSGFFPQMRWSLITLVAVAAVDEGGAVQALGELLQSYWQPLYVFARRSGMATADAEDAVQDFGANLIRLESFKTSCSARGRLRSFLLTSFQNHLRTLVPRPAAAETAGAACRRCPWMVRRPPWTCARWTVRHRTAPMTAAGPTICSNGLGSTCVRNTKDAGSANLHGAGAVPGVEWATRNLAHSSPFSLPARPPTPQSGSNPNRRHRILPRPRRHRPAECPGLPHPYGGMRGHPTAEPFEISEAQPRLCARAKTRCQRLHRARETAASLWQGSVVGAQNKLKIVAPMRITLATN